MEKENDSKLKITGSIASVIIIKKKQNQRFKQIDYEQK